MHRGERLLDIGANIGYVSSAFLHLVPDSRVAAVEPQPKCYALLRENLELNGASRAVAINAAISEASGQGRMRTCVGNSGKASLLDGSNVGAAEGEIDVALIDGARLMELAGLDRIDLIKIDVERHEEAVFRAIAGQIATHRPRAILFEHFGDLRDEQSYIRSLLVGNGYALFGISKGLTRSSIAPLHELAKGNKKIHDYVAVQPRAMAR